MTSSRLTGRNHVRQVTEGILYKDLGYVITVSGGRSPVRLLPQLAYPPPPWSLQQVVQLRDSDIKAGRIEYETGSVVVEVTMKLLLFRPFKNEVLDATVTTVNDVRSWHLFVVL
jgi:hypothetical protein